MHRVASSLAGGRGGWWDVVCGIPDLQTADSFLSAADEWCCIRHASAHDQTCRNIAAAVAPACIRLSGTNWQTPAKKREETDMRGHSRLVVFALAAFSLLLITPSAVFAADPEIDALLRSPVGKDWITNGGNLTNQRYSTLKQIDLSNVKQLKGAWMTRLKGSGLGGKYSFEASPLVKDGIMYVVTGNDDVFALNAKTGERLWEYWSGVGQQISTIYCGWVSRRLGMCEGRL